MATLCVTVGSKRGVDDGEVCCVDVGFMEGKVCYHFLI